MINKQNLFALSAAALTLSAFGFLGGCTSPTTPPATDTPTAKTDTGATPPKTTDAAKPTGRPATTGPGVTVGAGDDTIKIGLVASLNGENKPWGEDSQTGVQIAEDDINAAGGIKGKKVKFIVQDSNSTADGAKSAAENLVSQGVIAIDGEVASGNTAQIVTVAAEKGVPVVSIGSTRTDLADMSNVFFRVCYTDDFQGPVMAKFAWDGLKLKKVALMTDQKQPYSTGLSDSFSKAFTKLGGTIVDEQKYETGQANFSGLVEQLKSKNPDGIFMSGYFTEVGAIAKAIRSAGMNNVAMLGGDGWDSPSLITSGGDAIIGGYFCNHYSNFSPRPEVKSFLDKWAKKMNGTKPGTTMGALGYDAAMLTADALSKATDLSSAALIKSLDQEVNFPGVSGAITLKGGNGNPKKDALIVKVTKDGFVEAKTYKPEDVPTL